MVEYYSLFLIVIGLNKAIDNYAHALEFVLDQYKTQEMCIKAVDNYPSTIKYVPD